MHTVEPSGVVMHGVCDIQTDRCTAKVGGAITAVWGPNLAKAYLPPVGTEDGRTSPRRGRDVLPIVHVPGGALAIEAVACSACTCQRQTPSRGPNTRTHPLLRVRLFHELLQRLDRSLDW